MLRQTVLANFQKIWAYLFTVGMILLSLFPVYWVLTVPLKSKRDSLANPPLWLFEPVTSSYLKLWNHDTFKETFPKQITCFAFTKFAISIKQVVPKYCIIRNTYRNTSTYFYWKCGYSGYSHTQ